MLKVTDMMSFSMSVTTSLIECPGGGEEINRTPLLKDYSMALLVFLYGCRYYKVAFRKAPDGYKGSLTKHLQ